MGNIISEIEKLMPSKELGEKRMEICRHCGLYKKDLFSNHPKCSSSLYINPKTNETSKTYKQGFFRGCGCYLEYKVYNTKSSCPANKW